MQFVQNFANIRKYSQIVLTNKSHSGVAMQGSKNCGSRAGRKWRQREEMGGKICPALYGSWALVRHFTQFDLVSGGHS